MKSSFDGFFEWMEEDALENGSQGYAFGVSFTGMGEKENMQFVLYGKHSLNPSHSYVFPFPGTDFCLGNPKFIMWAHSAGFVRERFQTGLLRV
jgi:hypothetical protein